MFIADNGGFHSSGAVTKFAAITVEVCFIFFEMFSLSTTSIRLIAVDCFFVLLAFFSLSIGIFNVTSTEFNREQFGLSKLFFSVYHSPILYMALTLVKSTIFKSVMTIKKNSK